MNVFYIANMRIPTEKAHGFAAINMCRAFVENGTAVILVVPRRRVDVPISIRKWYDDHPVHIVRIPCIDLLGIRWVPRYIGFVITAFSFYAVLTLRMVFWKRRTIYARDVAAVIFRLLGYPVFVEVHAVPTRVFAHRLIARANGIVTIAEPAQNKLIESGIHQSKVICAPSGVDLSLFDIPESSSAARSKLGLAQDAFIAVYTGSFTTFGKEKGIQTCIDAMEHVDQCHFIAVGGSDEELEQYQRYVAKSAAAARITLIGRRDQKALALYQKAADVLLAPFPDTSHYRHNMSPMKLAEYAAAQRAIITSSLPTTRSLFTADEVLFVEPGSATALAAALQTLRLNDTLRDSFARKARARVDEYTWMRRACRVQRFIQNHL